MNKYKLGILVASIVLLMAHGTSFASNDPGIKDTVKLEGGPLIVGQSIPLSFTIVNDYEVGCFSFGFIFDSVPGGGFAVFDSVAYVNRMSDPRVISFRVAKRWDDDPAPPDTVVLGGEAYAQLNLPPGNDPTTLVYFTGVSAGVMSVDSGFFPPAGNFILCTTGGYTYTPECITPDIDVLEGDPPPQILINATTPRVVCGSTVEFDIEASSPVGFPITLSLVELVGYDDETQLPANNPTLSSANPAEFTWNTTCDDIGIWLATFSACDSTGTCVTAKIDIQVVESQYYLSSFTMTETTDVGRFNSLQHGNFDDDPNLELAGSGSAAIQNSPEIELLDYAESGSLVSVYAEIAWWPAYGLQIGYINDDAQLDAVLLRAYSGAQYHVTTFPGDGNNGFGDTATSAEGNYRARNSTIGEFTGDQYLDYISVSIAGNAEVFAGIGHMRFLKSNSIYPGGDALSVNTADFDDDGYADLAVGTASGVYIFLGNGDGSFTQTHFYSQVYGSVDIEVTNQGSDFNNDNIFDLCISTPSIGGEYSEMVMYLGQGDGSFTQHVIRTVRGQIFGNCVGDFNNDGELDIAFVNGAREYIAILFGDGTGTFLNELRYPIPHENPCQIDNYDVDLDGDIDLIVIANDHLGYNSLFYLSNNLDPSGFVKTSFSVSACDNSTLELTSSTGKVFNRIKSTMPSAKYLPRNINSQGILDEFATLGVVESGEYMLTVTARPNLPVGNPFTIDYMLNGEPYRLAKDIPMSESGYVFNLHLEDNPGVLPRSGKYIQANPPTFVWDGTGQFDFQLASDIDFMSLVADVSVDGNMYTLLSALEVSDTATYYWRVKPEGIAEYDCLYAINMVTGSNNAGDANGDGMLNVADAVFIINYVFKGGAAPDPLSAGDANCDGDVNVGDAVCLINYIFKGGSPPGCP